MLTTSQQHSLPLVSPLGSEQRLCVARHESRHLSSAAAGAEQVKCYWRVTTFGGDTPTDGSGPKIWRPMRA
ncbi:MAG: hypothetical protein ACXWBO_17910, partial [Ilumatobacteraceae bacterium]